jgi:hypothetical protein
VPVRVPGIQVRSFFMGWFDFITLVPITLR